jgi:hypothetical protein
MGQTVECPKCNKGYRFKPELAGKKVKCGGCGVAFVFPAALAPEPAASPVPVQPVVADLLDEEYGVADSAGSAACAPQLPAAGPRNSTAAASADPPARLPERAVTDAANAAAAPLRQPRPKMSNARKRQMWSGIGLGAIAFVALGVIACVLVALFGGFSDTLESVGKNLIATANEFADVLEKVEDGPSAKAVRDKVQTLGERYVRLAEKAGELSKDVTPEEAARLDKLYGQQTRDAMKRMTTQAKRIGQIPEARAELEEPMLAFGREMLRVSGQSAPDSPRQVAGGRTSGSTSGKPARGKSNRLPSQEEAIRKMSQQHGNEKVITVEVYGVPSNAGKFVQSELRKIAGKPQVSASGSDDVWIVSMAPVATDIQTYAAKIPFARTVSVNAGNRTIIVGADPAKFPPPPKPAVTDPKDPAFYRQNLADLRGDDSWRQKEAIDRLAKAEPKELRKEIFAALEEIAQTGEWPEHEHAMLALPKWGEDDAVRALIALAGDSDQQRSHMAFGALAAIPKPQAIEFLAGKLETEFFTRVQAERALKKMGSPAEDAVLKLLDSGKRDTVTTACSVLGSIGTEKSLARLRQLADSQDFFVKTSARDACEEITARSGKRD